MAVHSAMQLQNYLEIPCSGKTPDNLTELKTKSTNELSLVKEILNTKKILSRMPRESRLSMQDLKQEEVESRRVEENVLSGTKLQGYNIKGKAYP